jgi:carbamoyltransferase
VRLRDGDLVAAVEQECFRRVRHWAGFSREAIHTCLDLAGVTPAERGHFAISRDPRANLLRKALFALRNRPSLGLVRDRMKNSGHVHDVAETLADLLHLDRERVRGRMHWVEHHPAHLASAFFASPFEAAAVCAIDGFGDFVSTSWASGHGARLDMLERVFFPHSLGLMYLTITQYLGFLNYGDEYKVMGLAPYGEPSYVDVLQQLVHLKPGGGFELDLAYFRHWSKGVSMTWDGGEPVIGQVYTPRLESLLGPARRPDEPLEPRHEAVAASLQVVFEEAAFHVLNALYQKTRQRYLCLAGGSCLG